MVNFCRVRICVCVHLRPFAVNTSAGLSGPGSGEERVKDRALLTIRRCPLDYRGSGLFRVIRVFSGYHSEVHQSGSAGSERRLRQLAMKDLVCASCASLWPASLSDQRSSAQISG